MRGVAVDALTMEVYSGSADHTVKVRVWLLMGGAHGKGAWLLVVGVATDGWAMG